MPLSGSSIPPSLISSLLFLQMIYSTAPPERNDKKMKKSRCCASVWVLDNKERRCMRKSRERRWLTGRQTDRHRCTDRRFADRWRMLELIKTSCLSANRCTHTCKRDRERQLKGKIRAGKKRGGPERRNKWEEEWRRRQGRKDRGEKADVYRCGVKRKAKGEERGKRMLGQQKRRRKRQ